MLDYYSRGMPKGYEDLKGVDKDPLERSRDQKWHVCASVKDHQMLFVGGPNTSTTNRFT